MNESNQSAKCTALFEACTLSIYDKNIFRLTGLPVDASARDISKQAQKLQMLEEMGGDVKSLLGAFAPKTLPTVSEIREALARMKDPEQRIIDEFFWFWPETFGESKNDEAIQAALSGKADNAYELWRSRENEGSHVAQHNVAVLYHMYAIEWTNFHATSDTTESQEETIKTYWKKSFDRWEKMIDVDDLWGTLKDRIRSYDDHALTTGYARRIRKDLPEALDKINAEAALKLAEQGRMDWAKYHVDLMNETHAGLDDVESTAEMVLEPSKKRVEHHLSSFRQQTKSNPKLGSDLAEKLLTQCKPIMQLFDLFHGEKAHQRNDLFDSVAETVLEMVVSHQKSTGDDKSFVLLLKRALVFANGPHIRERIIKNISIGDGNMRFQQLKPYFDRLKEIMSAKIDAPFRLERILHELVRAIPEIKRVIGSENEACGQYIDSVALALRDVSVEAHNSSRDYITAFKALNEATKLNPSVEVRSRIIEDATSLQESKNSYKCSVCGLAPPDPASAIIMPIASLSDELIRELSREDFNRGHISAPCCRACKSAFERSTQPKASSGCLVTLFAPLTIGGVIIYHAINLIS